VDLGMIMGTGFPPFRGGLLRFADSESPQKVADTLEKFAQQGGGERVRPNAALLEVARKGSFY
jgi:3-hydroxyacyl-CoA dehydrogenase/enoyl-CoA hydratase/3-hydroxybutyryl-CoA epimerase